MTKERLYAAQERMAMQANKHRRESTFAAGDKVLLDKSNLNLQGSKKLKAHFVGPFKIVKLVGPVACKLELGSRLKGVHDAFHVSLLKKYEAGGD